MKNSTLFNLKNLFLILFLFIGFQVIAQKSDSTLQSGELLVIRPLENLIAEALQKSPLLKIQNVKIQKKVNETKLVRRKWADYVAINGNYQFGNSLILDAVQTGTITDASTTDRSNVFFNLGASLRLPFGDVWSRGTRLKVAEQEVEIERLTHQELERQIREAVISTYMQLQTSLNIMRVKSKEIENRKITLETAEKYFRDGTLPLAEYNEAVARLTSLEEAYEQGKGNVMLHYWALKELTGTNINE